MRLDKDLRDRLARRVPSGLRVCLGTCPLVVQCPYLPNEGEGDPAVGGRVPRPRRCRREEREAPARGAISRPGEG